MDMCVILTAPEPEEANEMSDEALLQATQDIEQLTAGCQTAGNVPTLSSRELFVATTKAQGKGLQSKRKLEKEKEGIVKRKYEQKKPVTCKLCGQDHNPPVHVHYFMNWYCGATANILLEDLKQELYKKGYGKKQK